MKLHEIVTSLDAQISKEQERVRLGIVEARNTHTSVHNGYWEHLWALRQQRIAAQMVADVVDEVIGENT